MEKKLSKLLFPLILTGIPPMASLGFWFARQVYLKQTSNSQTEISTTLTLSPATKLISYVPKTQPSTNPTLTPSVTPTPDKLPTNVNPQTTKTVEQQLDDLADKIFYNRHPELQGRKLQATETALIQEWARIRRCEAVVDYLFYQKHPQLQGRAIHPDEKDLAQEWLEIQKTVKGCY